MLGKTSPYFFGRKTIETSFLPVHALNGFDSFYGESPDSDAPPVFFSSSFLLIVRPLLSFPPVIYFRYSC